jgi:O-antigen/teichoic acid export membrane protein
VWRALLARGLRPHGVSGWRRARPLAGATLPLGITVILNTALLRIDALLLSAHQGAAAVGVYGAAYRLLESVLVFPYTFVAALLPTLSRSTRDSTPPLRDVTQLGLKLVLAVMLPIGTAFVVFAEPMVHLLYSNRYEGSVSALRLLGGATGLYGVSYLCSYVLIGQGRERVLPGLTAAVLAVNVALNLILIPSFAEDGAALATSLSEAVLATASLVLVVRLTGALNAARMLVSPVAGCLAVAAVGLLLGPTLITLALAVVVYPLVLIAMERLVYRDDLYAAGAALGLGAW